MIRFVSDNNTIVNKYCICKDQLKFSYFSAKRQPIISFIIIKNLIAGDKKKSILQAFRKSRLFYVGVYIMSGVLPIINLGQRFIWYL